MRKGSIRILEAAMAAVMMVTFIAFASLITTTDSDSPVMAREVYKTYEYLDKSNKLRSFAMDDPKNMTAFKDSVSEVLPSTYEFEVGYKDDIDEVLSGELPENVSIYHFSYIISGYAHTYDPTEFRIYVW